MKTKNSKTTAMKKTTNNIIDLTFGSTYRTLNLSAECVKLLAGALKHKVDDSKSVQEYILEYDNLGLRDVLLLRSRVQHNYNKAQINTEHNNVVRKIKADYKKGTETYIKALNKAKDKHQENLNIEISAYKELKKMIKDGVFDMKEPMTVGKRLDKVSVVKPVKPKGKTLSQKVTEAKTKAKAATKKMVDKLSESLKEETDKPVVKPEPKVATKPVVKPEPKVDTPKVATKEELPPVPVPVPVTEKVELPTPTPAEAFSVPVEIPVDTPAEMIPDMVSKAVKTAMVREPRQEYKSTKAQRKARLNRNR